MALIPNLSILVGSDGWKQRLLRQVRPDKLAASRRMLILNHDRKTKIAEPYHTLRANLLSKLPAKGKSLSMIFTSSSSAEGKTLCSLNFAFSAASAGLRTLLVDVDMRRPSIHRMLGLSREPGFTDVVGGKGDWREVIRGTADLLMMSSDPETIMFFPGIDNLKILTVGMNVSNHMEILENARLAPLIEEWKRDFDLIIFDTPPILIFVDALLLARQVDAAVLVYGAGKVSRMALKRAKEQLQNFVSKDKLIGVAINNLQAMEMGTLYGYGDYNYR
jgi:capsular exopolysaccharide synthesis family protein